MLCLACEVFIRPSKAVTDPWEPLRILFPWHSWRLHHRQTAQKWTWQPVFEQCLWCRAPERASSKATSGEGETNGEPFCFPVGQRAVYVNAIFPFFIGQSFQTLGQLKNGFFFSFQFSFSFEGERATLFRMCIHIKVLKKCKKERNGYNLFLQGKVTTRRNICSYTCSDSFFYGPLNHHNVPWRNPL